jgi:hypothetical protein
MIECRHMATVQYTVRGIPREVDAALRRKARKKGTSLNKVLVEALSSAEGVGPIRRRKLSDLGGKLWIDDPEFEKILAEQRVIDPELWK